MNKRRRGNLIGVGRRRRCRGFRRAGQHRTRQVRLGRQRSVDLRFGVDIRQAIACSGRRVAGRHHTTVFVDGDTAIRARLHARAAPGHLKGQRGDTQRDRAVRDQLPAAVTVERTLLDMHQQAGRYTRVSVRVGSPSPSASRRHPNTVFTGRRLLDDQHTTARWHRHPINGLQAVQRDVGRGGHQNGMFEVLPRQFAGHKLASGQHHARVNFQLDAGRVAHDQVHPHDLRAARTLRQQWLERRRAVGNGHQITVRIVQADFTNPLSTDLGRDDLLSDDDRQVCRVLRKLIQGRSTPFVDERFLIGIGLRVCAVGIPDPHLGDLPCNAQGIGIGLLGDTDIGQDGVELRVLIDHEYTSRVSMVVSRPPHPITPETTMSRGCGG